MGRKLLDLLSTWQTMNEPTPATGNAGEIDSSTSGPASAPAPADARIERASQLAIEKHLDERPAKRKPGRPPTKAKKFPPAPPVEGIEAALEVEPAAPPAPVFDEETYSTLVQGVIEMLNDFAESFMRSAAGRYIEDKKIVEETAKKARMSDNTRGLVQAGAMGCVRKYAIGYQYASETALACGLAVWVLSQRMALSEIKRAAAAAQEQIPAPAPGTVEAQPAAA